MIFTLPALQYLRLLIYFLFLGSMLTLSFEMQASNSPHQPTLEKRTFQLKDGLTIAYVIQYPSHYKKGKQYPLIVFLHGAGERGDNLDLVSVHGPLQYTQQGNELDAIIIAPQCPSGIYWGEGAAKPLPLIEYIIKTESVDDKRVYLTGLSMGGYGTWLVALAQPKLFAALVPVCGPIFRTFPRRACQLKEIPTWVFHGALDDVVDINESSKMVKALQKCGGKPKYTVYPTANHNSWTKTYANPALYEWMFKQTK